MLKNKILLLDNTEITAGTGDTAIMAVKLTQAVNTGTELTLGSVCAAMAEITLLTESQCPIAQGDSFTLYKVPEEGKPYPVGIFTAQEPRHTSAHVVKITAYDNVAKLDQNVSLWLEELTQWPYTLGQLAQMVCDRCGVAFDPSDFPNREHPVEAFSGRGVTGRKIVSWIAEAAGRFCTARTDGILAFSWYTPQDLCLEAGGTDYYFQGGLSCADYTVAPVDKVQIRQEEKDIGTVWPDTDTEGNLYRITANPLLTATGKEDLLPIAQDLFAQLRQVTYTPCTVTVPAGTTAPGRILQVVDRRGNRMTMYVMGLEQSGQTEKLTCTGSPNRELSAVVNSSTYQALSGRVLQLSTDVEGLKAKNADADGNHARLELTVAGIQSQVSAQQTGLGMVQEETTQLRQSADALELEMETIRQEGTTKVHTATGYSFTDQGLRIQKSGQEMENLLDNTGMYVRRSGQNVLTATNLGVRAVDVTVENYLVVGDHARFENHPNGRTACYYM